MKDDYPIRSRVHYQEHTGIITHVTDQPTEDIILARNAELRKNPGAIRDLGSKDKGGTWGRSVANIPFITLERAKRDGYELNHPDKEHRSKELFRFLNSEEGKKCLIQEKL